MACNFNGEKKNNQKDNSQCNFSSALCTCCCSSTYTEMGCSYSVWYVVLLQLVQYCVFFGAVKLFHDAADDFDLLSLACDPPGFSLVDKNTSRALLLSCFLYGLLTKKRSVSSYFRVQWHKIFIFSFAKTYI